MEYRTHVSHRTQQLCTPRNLRPDQKPHKRATHNPNPNSQVPFLRAFVEASSCLSFYVSVSFSLPLLPATSLVLIVASRVPLRARVFGAAAAQAAALLCLLLVDFAGGLAYLVGSIAVISSLTVIMQSSLYGFASTLPPALARALVIGQGSTGLISSAVQVFTQLVAKTSTSYDDDVDPYGATDSDWAAAIACSSAGAAFVLAGAAGFYWLTMTAGGQEALLAYKETQSPSDALLAESGEASPKMARSASAGSLALTSRSEEEEEATQLLDAKPAADEAPRSSTAILRDNWVAVAALFSTLFITMLIFPGLLLSLQYRSDVGRLSDSYTWWPILLLGLYNVGDCSGRVVPGAVNACAGRALAGRLECCAARFDDARYLAFSLLRLAFIPLLLYNISDALSLACALLLGFTNGWLQLETLISIPRRTQPSERESVGTLLSATINVGIVLGSCAALGLSPSGCL